MALDRTKGVPAPPHPQHRREPLPWHRPKSAEEDPGAAQAIHRELFWSAETAQEIWNGISLVADFDEPLGGGAI